MDLSIAVAVIASYAALYLAGRVTAHPGHGGSIWIVVGGVAMGIGIWSMHFVGMLAFQLPLNGPMSYDTVLTLLSQAPAIGASALALTLVSRPRLQSRHVLIGGILIATGISSMHYIGMAAMRVAPAITYDPVLLAASVAIALAASYLALWFAFELRERYSAVAVLAKLGGAVILGGAISSMHYVGMAAAQFAPETVSLAATEGHNLTSASLAHLVGGASIVLLLATLIASALDAHMADKQTRMADRLRADNQHLQSIAFRDSLTGLTNRALLEDRLTQEIRHAERGGRIFAVLFIDLDSFKPVNDAYGHRSGDFMLTVLADRLVGAVRGTDTVARVGGDEFVVILSELADPRDAAALCEKIRDAIAQPVVLPQGEVAVSCSIGISLYPDHGTDTITLLENADAAMYAAKAENRHGYRFFKPDMKMTQAGHAPPVA